MGRRMRRWLAQVSAFSLAIVSLGIGHGHVSAPVGPAVLYTRLVTEADRASASCGTLRSLRGRPGHPAV
jgi:hypothetical protein